MSGAANVGKTVVGMSVLPHLRLLAKFRRK